MVLYLTPNEVEQINARFLGVSALRDEPALQATLARPLAVAYYEQADIVAQAAVFIEGIAQALAFVDGNKRTATAAGLVFLRLNGYTLRYTMNPLVDELGQQVLELVTHQSTRDVFIDWVRSHLVLLP